MSDSILIVDYERGIRESLSAVLRDEGFTAEAVASGEECLQALARRGYACVLLDVWLPGISGLETLKQMRELDSDAAVVIISVYSRASGAKPRRKYRQWRSVQSIMGATEMRRYNILISLLKLVIDGQCQRLDRQT